jgi:hypothetical protein
MRSDIGTRVVRKRDSATGVITSRVLSVSPVSRPGVFGQTVVGVTLDDAALRAAAGGEMVGELGWLKSNFWLEKRGEVVRG